MSHHIDTMAYVGETPWHKLGTKVPELISPEEFVKLAGLDWTVEAVPLFADLAGQAVPVEGYSALMRSTDRRVYGVAQRFRPFQNAEIFEFFGEFVRANRLTIETGGSLKDGELVWALARAEEEAEIVPGDRVQRYYLLINSHKPGVAFRYMECQTRVVCWNTLQIALSERQAFKIKHNGADFEQYREKIAEDLKLADDASRFEESVEFAREFTKVRMTEASNREFIGELAGWTVLEAATKAHDARQQALFTGGNLLDGILAAHDAGASITREQFVSDTQRELSRTGKAILDAIIDAPGSGMVGSAGTLWGTLNGVTYWADHEKGGGLEKRAASVVTGSRGNYKARAYKQALQIAGRAGA